MTTNEAFRQFVMARAGGACEYCRLLQDASGVTFHVEHVCPRSLGGQIEVGNLALSCPGCNLSKARRLMGTDFSGNEQAIYNPRAYEPSLLGWHLHFTLDRKSGRIVGRTPTGEATIRVLNMNDRYRTFARKLQIDAGLIA